MQLFLTILIINNNLRLNTKDFRKLENIRKVSNLRRDRA